MKSVFSFLTDDQYMEKALEYAQKAYDQQEVPIGALVVNNEGIIIGSGFNQVEKKKTQTAHAEMQAIQEASFQKGDWRLENCFLYVTLEPCAMCMGALRLSRVKGVIFGATSNLFGYHLDRDSFIPLYNKDKPFLKGGVCEQKSIDILKKFFANKRKKSE